MSVGTVLTLMEQLAVHNFKEVINEGLVGLFGQIIVGES